jgi:predicted deacylase
MQIGTASARPGQMAFGHLEVLRHVDGTPERLPVIVAAGKQDGPCLWVTANIHGDEGVGLIAVQEAITRGLAKRLGEMRGTVVAIPSLNPAGLRVSRRKPYYDPETDPNRTFPDVVTQADEDDPPPPVELASGIWFDLMRQTATYLVDLHSMDIQATPFTIRDHVLYRERSQLTAARRLAETTDGLARAFGIPIVNEYGPQRYVAKKLHRSTAGAALHMAGIPAITPELGMTGDVDPLALRAGVAGIRNVLLWAGMLDGEPEVIDWIPRPDLGYPVGRLSHPRSPHTGIAHKVVRPGEVIHAGQVVAELRDIWGQPLDGDGLVRTAHDGWVLSVRSGIGVFEGAALLEIAARDDEPLVLPWPKRQTR